MDKLPIVDLYTCIQGEGKFSGIPHILIRFTGCNLNCQFKDSFCDTSYTSWKPFQGSYTFEDIEKKVLSNPAIKSSYITGGEPSLYPDILKELVILLKKHRHFVIVETNGTNYFNTDADFISISPKMSNSVPVPGTNINDEYIKRAVTLFDKERHEKNRSNPEVIKKLIKKYNYLLKFVVSAKPDLEEIQELIRLLGITNDKAYLMPEGISNEQLQEKRKWLFDICIKYGYNYSDRLQIVAFGNTRNS